MAAVRWGVGLVLCTAAAAASSGSRLVCSRPLLLSAHCSIAVCMQLWPQLLLPTQPQLPHSTCKPAPLLAGRTYRPNVVRVGSEVGGAVNPAVRDRLVGLMVERYKNMSQADWQHRCVACV